MSFGLHYGDFPPPLKQDADPSRDAKIRELGNTLDVMCKQVTGFYVSVHLFWKSHVLGRSALEKAPEIGEPDSRRSKALFDEWMMVACRDGAIRLADFEDALHAANTQLFSLIGRVEKPEPNPFTMLEVGFPDLNHVRTGAAHTAVPVMSDAKRDQHSHKGGVKIGNMSFGGGQSKVLLTGLNGRYYFNTWKGKITGYDVTEESIEKLEAVKSAFFKLIPSSLRATEGASQHLKDQSIQLRKTRPPPGPPDQ